MAFARSAGRFSIAGSAGALTESAPLAVTPGKWQGSGVAENAAGGRVDARPFSKGDVAGSNPAGGADSCVTAREDGKLSPSLVTDGGSQVTRVAPVQRGAIFGRRSILRGFLALPVGVKLAPVVAATPAVAEAARNIFVKDMGLWFASFPEMYRAFNWDFRNHVVETVEGYTGSHWCDMTGKPKGVMGYVIGCTFTQMGPPPEPLRLVHVS
jgi:hypothetical protein